MNLLRELKRLNMDALEKALSNLSTEELLGLAKPIASTPFSLRGKGTTSMYLSICDELEHRNANEWMVMQSDFERREKTASRMNAFLAPFSR
ncbi:hypothetical protein N9F11_01605 [Akkermansiaceae bacterium]|nr:hypothetical protein [Akkermansiaceae bacterium]